MSYLDDCPMPLAADHQQDLVAAIERVRTRHQPTYYGGFWCSHCEDCDDSLYIQAKEWPCDTAKDVYTEAEIKHLLIFSCGSVEHGSLEHRCQR